MGTSSLQYTQAMPQPATLANRPNIAIVNRNAVRSTPDSEKGTRVSFTEHLMKICTQFFFTDLFCFGYVSWISVGTCMLFIRVPVALLALSQLGQSHYYDVIMSAMVSQNTSLRIVHSTVYSRRRSKKTSKLRVTGLCEGFPAQRASNW